LRVHGQTHATFGSPCGRWVAMLTQNGPSSPFPLYCRRWACKDCRERRIDEYISKARAVFGRCLFLYQGVYDEDLPGLTKKIGQAGTYCRMKLENGRLFIISAKKIEGATKMKKKEIDKMMSDALDYDGPGRRVNWGKTPGSYNKKKIQKSSAYGVMDANYRLPYYACKSEEEKARWIFQNSDRFLRIYPAGIDLKNKYKNQWATWALDMTNDSLSGGSSPRTTRTYKLPNRDFSQGSMTEVVSGAS